MWPSKDPGEFLLQNVVVLTEPIGSISPWMLALVGFLGLSTLLVGRRAVLVVKPDRPYLSPMVRWLGNTIRRVGMVVTATGVGWVVAVLTLMFLHEWWWASRPFTSAVELSAKTLWALCRPQLLAWLLGNSIGIVVSLPLIWRVIPAWERGPGLPDVEELTRRFKKFNVYDPVPYIDVGKGCFVGKSATGAPIYIPWRKLRETHGQVLGMTGSGKGVVMSLIAYQCVLAGESVVWFDPKFDRYSPRILQDAAKRASREFHLIDLRPRAGAQLNPLLGADEFEIEELLVAAFDLRSKGTDGDFHRGRDEDAAAEAARVAVNSGAMSIPDLCRQCASMSSITDQENFWRKLKKLARLPAVGTTGGVNLVEAVANGAVIYIIGSSDSESVKMLQKLLLVRIMQVIKGRERLDEHAPVCVVLDEFKHMLSPAAFTGLGVIRDYDAHFLLAHQSVGDLSACPGIDPAEAHGAVIDNTAIKIVYKIGDDQYAERLARVSGKSRTYVDSSSKQPDENGSAAGSWREEGIHHIEMDLLTHLPMPSDRAKQASVGVLFGIGNAQLFYVGPIPTSGDMPTPIPVEAVGPAADLERELI